MSLDQRHSPRALLGHGALPQTDKRCCPGKLPDNPRALHTTQRVTKANLTKQEKIWTIVFTTEGGQKKARFSGKKEGGWGEAANCKSCCETPKASSVSDWKKIDGFKPQPAPRCASGRRVRGLPASSTHRRRTAMTASCPRPGIGGT